METEFHLQREGRERERGGGKGGKEGGRKGGRKGGRGREGKGEGTHVCFLKSKAQILSCCSTLHTAVHNVHMYM